MGKDVVQLAKIGLNGYHAAAVRVWVSEQATEHTQRNPNQCLSMAVPMDVSQL
jgi:hypothetical protein